MVSLPCATFVWKVWHMIDVAVYDTKPYDRQYLSQAPGSERVAWRFHDFRLSAETAQAAKGAVEIVRVLRDMRPEKLTDGPTRPMPSPTASWK